MPKFLVERVIPGAGSLTSQELCAISQKSCGVLRDMGPQIQWVHSYVTENKIYCVYIAPDEASVPRTQPKPEVFPPNVISRILRHDRSNNCGHLNPNML